MADLKKVQAVAKLGAAKQKQLAAKGRRAIAIVLKMKAQVEQAFYAMGRALAVLHDPGVFHAMGYTSFEQLCNARLGISESQAGRLIAITEHFGARDAKRLVTSTRGTAIIDLAGALGGKTTPKGLLSRGTIHLPDGESIDVRTAEAHVIERAAHRVRSGRKRSSHGGLAISAEAKKFFARLRAATKRAKLRDVRIEEIAASEAEGARMRIVASVRDAPKLASALRTAST